MAELRQQKVKLELHLAQTEQAAQLSLGNQAQQHQDAIERLKKEKVFIVFLLDKMLHHG